VKSTLGWLRASLRLPLIVLMLLTGLLIAKTVIPWSGPSSSSRYRSTRNQCVMHWCRTLCRILNLKIQRQGAPGRGANLWVSNHISWIDILALATEHDLVFVAKHEVSTWPLMGSIFSGIGTLFIRRGDRDATQEMARTMRAHLEAGIALMLFPEATTTDGSEVRRFGSKLLEPAVQSQSPLQPVALRYQGTSREIAPFIGEDTFAGHLLRVLTLHEIELIISYGAVIVPENLSKEQLARRLHQSVIGLMAAAQPSN
jgi:lyso-ornithine lipid O-acyltransferase